MSSREVPTNDASERDSEIREPTRLYFLILLFIIIPVELDYEPRSDLKLASPTFGYVPRAAGPEWKSTVPSAAINF